jgi:hypothetical protein
VKGRIEAAFLPLSVLAVILLAALATTVATADAATPKLPPLPKEFSGSFDATIEGSPSYNFGELVASADTLKLHATNVVFRRSGVGYYTLVKGTGEVTDSGMTSPSNVYGCPCEQKFTYDPGDPFSPPDSPLAGDFTITPAPGADSWEGATAKWVALSIPSLETQKSQTGTTTTPGVIQVIGAQSVGNGVFVEAPVPVKVNPDGDYTIQYSTKVSLPFSEGETETDTDSALLTGLPADEEEEPTAISVSGNPPTLTFTLGAPATETFTLQRRQGGAWVKAKTVTKHGTKGKNSLKLSTLFGAKALKKAGSYRVAIGAAGGKHAATETKAFTIR